MSRDIFQKELNFMDNTFKTTEAQRKASAKYKKEKTDKIEVRVPKGQKSEIQSYAQYKGISVNALINQLLQKEINNLTR